VYFSFVDAFQHVALKSLQARMEVGMSGKQLGTVGMIGIGWFVVAVVALDVIEPEFSVVDEYMSDYALGNYGWLMRSAFFAVGLGIVAIGLGLRKTLGPGKRVAASVVMFVSAGIGFLVVGMFNTDPTGVTDLTTVGTLHVLGSVVIFFSLLIAAWMVRGVFKRDPTWEPFAKTQMWFAIAYTVTMFVMFGTPEDGPVGLTQRIFIPVMMGWLFTLAWNIRRNATNTEAQ
jgi:hypothetical membrane protein